jgi:hypothetical protein
MSADQIAHKVEKCGSCGARIIFCINESGITVPIDAEPSPRGTYRLVDQYDGAGRLIQPRNVLVKIELRFGRTNLHTSHFQTCPNRARHRRRGTVYAQR